MAIASIRNFGQILSRVQSHPTTYRAFSAATTGTSDCTLSRTAEQLSQLSTIGYVYLGEVPYRKALEMQKQLCRRRIDEIYALPQADRADLNLRQFSDTLILLQHPPVYTNGRRNHGKLQPDEIERLHALDCDYVETNRGGEITFHGPGQLVGYPNLYLKDHFLATKCFVKGLEYTIAETCAHFGIEAKTIPGFPGVWTSPTQKVAALGTHVQRYVTSHGFALNCTTNMKWFREIIPCGLEGKTAISLQTLMEQHGKPNCDTSVDAVLPILRKSFAKVFGCNVKPLEDVSPATFKFIQELVKL
ncbi:hypothetical protein IWW49_003065 [Coemansia sp. RSA 1797]|nr:hypothetical protein IWW49_003065 [Coemansia sp. RSA 1797]